MCKWGNACVVGFSVVGVDLFQLQRDDSRMVNGNGCVRILHVDDDLSVLEVSKQILLDINGGFEIDHACCVDEAFKKLLAGNYDVIISDYEMPQKDGLQFLKELREQKNTIPFILFTGKGREEVAIKALNLGADGYINKQGAPETVYGELAHGIKQSVARKKAEEELAVSEKKFRAIFEGARDGILAADAETKKFVFANPRIHEITGYSEQELLRLSVKDIHPEKDLPYVMDAFVKQLQRKTEIAKDLPVLRKDRTVVYCDVNSYLLEVGERKLLVGLFRDVTERRKAEEDLRMSVEKTRNVLAASPDAITISDLNGRIVDCNQATVALHGYGSKEEVVGKNAFELIAKKDHKRVQEKMVVQPIKNLELTFVAKDGHEFQAEMSTNTVMDALGKPEYFMAITKDITERKKMEKQLKDQERLASIGATAGMVGHDIRNPLQSIISSLYLIESDLDKLPESEETNNSHVELSSILEEINYVDKIVSDLQDYARPLKLELVEVDVKMLVTGALSTLNVPDDVEAYAYFDAKLSKLITDPIILKRVLFNLAINAIQAMPEGGKLTIHANMDKKASNLIITVEDTGVGIPKDVQDKLFTPLFTTKSKGQGFGLAVVKRMTEALGGTVTFESQEGKGTAFIVRLPPATKR